MSTARLDATSNRQCCSKMASPKWPRRHKSQTALLERTCSYNHRNYYVPNQFGFSLSRERSLPTLSSDWSAGAVILVLFARSGCEQDPRAIG